MKCVTTRGKYFVGLCFLAIISAACASTPLVKPPSTTNPNSTLNTHPSTTVAKQSTTSQSSATSTSNTSFVHEHVFVIVMENLGYSAALATPTLASLANHWVHATNYYATTHPSLPNYISLVAGSTLGITSDCVTCFVNAPSLMDEMDHAGISWASYMESIPNSCYLAPYAVGNLYAAKHDPFVYFQDIRNSPTLCANIQPLHALETMLNSNSTNIANFVWITPNLCNDGHDCAPSTAATWLSQMVSTITSSSAWQQNGALYITWDEGNGGDYSALNSANQVVPNGGGGHILTIVVEPKLPHGTTISAPLDHYSLLKTIETNFNLGLLGASSNTSLAVLP